MYDIKKLKNYSTQYFGRDKIADADPLWYVCTMIVITDEDS